MKKRQKRSKKKPSHKNQAKGKNVRKGKIKEQIIALSVLVSAIGTIINAFDPIADFVLLVLLKL